LEIDTKISKKPPAVDEYPEGESRILPNVLISALNYTALSPRKS
jgi:hypothetical protein